MSAVGSDAKDFQLVAGDLSEKTWTDYKGENVVMNIFPGVDTGTCATSVRSFNKSASLAIYLLRKVVFAEQKELRT